MKYGFHDLNIGAIAALASNLDATMAGITVTTTEWDKLLQEDYIKDEIVEAIDNSTPFKDKLQRKGMIGGRKRVYPVKVGASQGQGARAEDASMPNYGAGEYRNAEVNAKYNYAPFKVTGQSLEFTTRAAFVEFGMQLLKDTKEGMQNFTGRQCWGDGSGKLALINNGAGYAGGTATVAVDSAYGVLWGSLAGNTTFLFRRNMYIQIAAENNGGNGYKITAVAATTITFTPVLANAVVDNDAIYILGSKDLEIEGWLKMVATSSFMTGELGLANDTYHGIDRSLYPEFEGNVLNAAAALSLANIRTLKDLLFKRTNQEGSTLCINNTEVTRDFEALLVANQRYIPATKLEAGYTSLEHDGLRWTKDAKAPAKSLNILRSEVIAWAQTRDPHWLKDGNGIMRVVAGQDALEGLLKWYSNLDCDEPRRLGISYNLTVA
jgi:hypothetical protein